MQEQSLDELDQATRQRLSRLASLPVDTTRLERLWQHATHNPVEPLAPCGHKWARWPMVRLAAAAVALTVGLGILLLGSGTSVVVAAPGELAQLHDMLISARSAVTQVNSIAQANSVLAGQWAQAPTLPAAPDEHVHACCLRTLRSTKVVMVLLQHPQDQPITLVVARAADVDPAVGRIIQMDRKQYVVHQAQGVRMLSTEIGDKYICVMGRVPMARLLETASGLIF